MTNVVADFLETSKPAAEAMLIAFQELEKGGDQNEILKNLLASGLEGAAKNLRGLIVKPQELQLLGLWNPVCTVKYIGDIHCTVKM